MPTPIVQPALLDIKCGLTFRDDFNRVDSDNPGPFWVEVNPTVSDADIVSNEFRVGNRAAISGSPIIQNTKTVQSFNFSQMKYKWNADGTPASSGFRTTSNTNGYVLLIDDFGGRLKIFKFGVGQIAQSAAVTYSTNTFYDVQFYSADGVQEGWSATDGSPTTVSAADTAFDGVLKQLYVFRGTSSLVTIFAWFEDCLWFKDKFVTVTNMQTGYKAKIRNAAMSIVAQATESGGTAKVDGSRFGSATELVPWAGWQDLIITDASDVIQQTINGPIYPGCSFVAA